MIACGGAAGTDIGAGGWRCRNLSNLARMVGFEISKTSMMTSSMALTINDRISSLSGSDFWGGMEQVGWDGQVGDGRVGQWWSEIWKFRSDRGRVSEQNAS